MRKKFISALLFGALLLGATSTFVSCKDYDDDISSLRTEITTNATDLTSLVNEKVTNLNAEIASLQSQQTALETAYKAADADLQTAISAAQATANSATATAAQNSQAIADLQAAAATKAELASAKAALEEAISNLQTAVNEANTKIASLDSKIDATDAKYAEYVQTLLTADNNLQQAIDEANAKITVAQSTADAAATAAANAQASADTNAANIAALSNDLKTVSSNLEQAKTDLSAQIQLVETNMTKQLADQKAEIESQIDVINSTLTSNQQAIEALQNKDSELAQKIQTNSEELAKLAAELGTVDTRIAESLKSANAYTDAQYAVLDGKITELTNAYNQHVEEAKEALEVCQTQIAGAYTQIAAANELIDGLEASKASKTELSAAIDSLGNIISDNQKAFAAYVASTATTLQTIQDNIEANTTDILVNAENIDRNTGNITQLQSRAEELQNQITTNAANISANTTAIAELTAKVEGYITSNNAAVEALKGTVTDNYTDLNTRLETLEACCNYLKGDNGEIANIVKDINTNKENIAANQEKIDALVAALEEAFGDIETSGTSSAKSRATIAERINAAVNNLKSQIETLQGEVEGLYEQMALQQEGFTQLSTIVSEEMERLTGVSYMLKGLVFSPYEYFNGIEAIGVYNFNYAAYKVDGADVTKDQSNDAPTVKMSGSDTLKYNVVPYVCASYYMNPSNAKIDTTTANIKKHFSYLVNTASMTSTRNITKDNITIDSARTAKGGLLNVYFRIDDYSKISQGVEDGEDNKVDVAALRYQYATLEGNDTTVTSDFAALKTYVVTGFEVNKVSTEGAVDAEASHKHLFKTAKEAVDDKAKTMSINIPYDSVSNGVDLDQWINIHYAINGYTDKLWGGQKTINQRNFMMKYEILGNVNPIDGVNESAYASIKGTKLTVHKANQPGVKAGNGIVGRHPLIRVTLIDKTKNEIAKVGYILVTITGDENSVAMPEINRIYQLVCADDTLSNVVSYKDIEKEVIDQVEDIDFESGDLTSYYMLERAADGTINVYNNNDTKSIISNLGTVTVNADSSLVWTLKGEQAYTQFVQNEKESISVNVKYIRKDGTGIAPIWLKLTWKPSEKKYTPVVTIADDDKVQADWHAFSSDKAGYADVHMQIGAPTSTTEAQFNQLILNRTFNTAPATIVKNGLIAAGYDKLAAKVSTVYRFAPITSQTKKEYIIKDAKGVDQTYTISVAEDGGQMYASKNGGDKARLASIQSNNGRITLATNAVATAVINGATFAEDVNTALTLSVQLVATTCEAIEGGDPTGVNIVNEKFDVRVLKPLYLNKVTVDNMKLNEGTGLVRSLKASFLDFVGYTPKTFEGVNTSGIDFYTFYKISNYKIDLDNAETDYSGVYDKINSKRFTLEVAKVNADGTETWESNTVNVTAADLGAYTGSGNGNYDAINGDAILGKIRLTQVNMSGANTFHITVPVTVTYAIGELVIPLQITVEASNGGQED